MAEVRFDEDEIEIEGMYSIQVSTSRVSLELELWGCDILPGSRLNDQSKAASTFELTRKRQLTAEAALNGNAGVETSQLQVPSVKISGSAGLAQFQEEELIESKSWEDRFVVCKSGKRWLIEEDCNGGLALSGTYIANQRLCSVVPKELSNNVDITAELVMRKRDLIVEPEGNPVQAKFRKHKHQQKFIAAIIAKSLVKKAGQEESELISGRMVIGRSSLRTNEDET